MLEKEKEKRLRGKHIIRGGKMTLSEIIQEKIKRDHRGKENAIKRKDLLKYAHFFDPELTDRGLRNIYCQLPLVSSSDGIFWPIRKSDLEEFKFYMKGKAIPLFNRYKMVAEKHRDLMEYGEVVQWNLF